MDIYSFGMCALEVRNPQGGGVVVVERGQIRRWKGEMEGGQVRYLVLREGLWEHRGS